MSDSTNENARRGGISVEVEHIFPIIKKWLYSEKEIFIREIVSNGCDAVTKLSRLISLGKASVGEWDSRITVSVSKSAKTITVTDNGIGMTEDELEKYLCQIALSGALDFIQKYEGESEGASSGIIGHFGLGFYSAFMVSESVEVITRSFTGSPSVRWICGESGEYEFADAGDNDEVFGAHGTSVIMHISDEGAEFLDEYHLREILMKYCAFMPVPIYYINEDKSDEDAEKDNKSDESGGEVKDTTPTPINDTTPLWQKNPSDCTDDEYRDFYKKVFHDFREPLFWIHLKADYPLNFKGILYFPKLSNEYESIEGQIKLYYNQVFVADNIKEVIPEYLLMLRGVLDCPELPLNVSRSYLQNSGYVAKISAHITKKVADKLNQLFTNDREAFEKIWRDIKTFVEYGCMRDRKFYDRVKGSVLYEKCGEGFMTLPEYLEAAKEPHENKVYYANDKVTQSRYISMFAAENVEVLLLDKVIDSQYISTVEMNESGVKFYRVDAEVADVLRDKDKTAGDSEALKNLFAPLAGEKTKIEFEALRDTATPAILNLSEDGRRYADMMKMYGQDMQFMMPTESTLIINTANPLIVKLEGLAADDAEKAGKIAKQVYYLTLMSNRRLTAEEMTEFMNGSCDILTII